MWTVRPETPEDVPAIEALIVLCFGPGRFAKSAYRLREGVNAVPRLSFVAYEDGVLRGSVRFWPVHAGAVRTAMLGPLAVQPDQRGRGIGIALMQAGIEAARAQGFQLLFLVGDEPYYSRVGFSRVPPGHLVLPGPVDPSRVLALELEAGALVAARGSLARPGLDQAVVAAGAPLGVRS